MPFLLSYCRSSVALLCESCVFCSPSLLTIHIPSCILQLTLPLIRASFALNDMVQPRSMNPRVLSYSMVSTTCWAALHILQYGFAITSLNGIQQYVTCQTAEKNPGILQIPIANLDDCIPMTVGHRVAKM